jgi:hypothetical protein
MSQVNPKHYTDRAFEVIDIIRDSLTPEEYQGFLKGQVLKYVLRAGKKANTPDISKALWYLNRLDNLNNIVIMEDKAE